MHWTASRPRSAICAQILSFAESRPRVASHAAPVKLATAFDVLASAPGGSFGRFGRHQISRTNRPKRAVVLRDRRNTLDGQVASLRKCPRCAQSCRSNSIRLTPAPRGWVDSTSCGACCDTRAPNFSTAGERRADRYSVARHNGACLVAELVGVPTTDNHFNFRSCRVVDSLRC